MNTEKIKKINDLLSSNVGNRIIQITSRKKDGSLRSFMLKRDSELEASIKGTKPDVTTKTNNTLALNGMKRIEEMTPDGISQWRILNLEKVTQITVNGIVHTFED